MSTQYLATIGDYGALAKNLEGALGAVGVAGSNDTYLRVDKHSGALTFGQANTPLPPGHRFAVALDQLTHGYLVWDTGKRQVLERHMVPMVQASAAPVPPDNKYGSFEEGGARPAIEMGLFSVEEPGFRLTFTSWSVSNDNRIRDLGKLILQHLGSADGQRGFIHPVVIVKSGSYDHKAYGEIHHIDFEVKDWLHADGQTFLKSGPVAAIASADEPAPWDDDMTQDERNLLKAG